MPGSCRICLGALESGEEYHRRCVRSLFGTDRVPEVDLDLAKFQTFALAMVGHTALSGAQRKISMGLTADRVSLRAEIEGGQYILKPRSEAYPRLPELEILSMRAAELAGVAIPPCGLVTLRDGSSAYVIKRFDRAESGQKIRMEELCQLAELPPKDKYAGSAELCVRLLRRHAGEPLIELAKLYRQLLVSWWLGNGDLHLKNLAVLCEDDGLVHLSPAYDVLATRVVIPADQLALTVGGKREHLTRNTWLEFAAYASIPGKAAGGIIDEILASRDGAKEMAARVPLTGEERDAFEDTLATRSRVLAG